MPWALPDFDSYPDSKRVVGAEVIPNGVRVRWSDDLVSEHHRYVLREHSPDPITTNPLSREQQIQFAELAPDLQIVAAEADENGGLVVQWSHGEVATSTYHPGWLRVWAAATPEAHELDAPVPWRSTIELQAHCFDASGLSFRTNPTESPQFVGWLSSLRTHGVGVLTGLAVEPTTITDIASLIGPVRTTNFGHVFDVQTKSTDVTSNAYTDLELPVHTDLDTREYMPGLQFLFCMRSDALGGESRLSDGAAICRYLREHEPAAFEALTTIPVMFANKAVETDYRHIAPFLVVDDDGELVEARWSPWLRGPLNASIADAERFYGALRLAVEMAEDQRFVTSVRLNPGDLLGFDNRRILHGRGAIDRTTGERWLRGCYVEREELESRLRIIARRGRESHN